MTCPSCLLGDSSSCAYTCIWWYLYGHNDMNAIRYKTLHLHYTSSDLRCSNQPDVLWDHISHTCCLHWNDTRCWPEWHHQFSFWECCPEHQLSQLGIPNQACPIQWVGLDLLQVEWQAGFGNQSSMYWAYIYASKHGVSDTDGQNLPVELHE